MGRRKPKPMTDEDREFFAGFEQIYPPRTRRGLALGDRVLMLAPHPWADHVGTVVDVQTTLIGAGVVIELEDGHRCMAFKGSDLRVIQRREE